MTPLRSSRRRPQVRRAGGPSCRSRSRTAFRRSRVERLGVGEEAVLVVELATDYVEHTPPAPARRAVRDAPQLLRRVLHVHRAIRTIAELGGRLAEEALPGRDEGEAARRLQRLATAVRRTSPRWPRGEASSAAWRGRCRTARRATGSRRGRPLPQRHRMPVAPRTFPTGLRRPSTRSSSTARSSGRG